jgi:hypothetical protein
MDDTTKLVAIYGALISTIALLWNIISAIRKSKAKLKVSANFGLRFLGDRLATPLGNQKPTLSVVITNTGSTTRYINRPFFKVSRKIDGESAFETLTPEETFPTKIEPGEVYKKTFGLESLNRDLFAKLKDKDSMVFVVTDTLGKTFASKPLKISSIKKYLAAFSNN